MVSHVGTLCTIWQYMRSSFFNISNGVKQGGMLSPKLFPVYMDDLSNLLVSSGVGCFLSNVCFNHVFYAVDLCLMAPCAIALQELLNICHMYSIIADLNFYALRSFCIAFTLKSFKLSFPKLYINTAPIPYTDSLKYLGFIFTDSHKDDSDMLRQMRMLYARSNRLVRLFHSCSRNVLIELGRSFCVFFTVVICGNIITKHHFLKLKLRTTTCIVNFNCMFLVAVAPAQCLLIITLPRLNA